jgi:hypothetical protein
MHQILMSTDQKAFEIKALGSSHAPYDNRLEAYVVTDRTLGPSGHGITGNGMIDGSLVSEPITEGDWHDVQLIKNQTHLSFTVDSNTITVPSSIDLAMNHTWFDLKPPGTEIEAGHKAGHGDIGLDGDLCAITLDLDEPHEAAAGATADDSAGADDNATSAF